MLVVDVRPVGERQLVEVLERHAVLVDHDRAIAVGNMAREAAQVPPRRATFEAAEQLDERQLALVADDRIEPVDPSEDLTGSKLG